MSDEDFGFSDEEVATREPDEFANMSEEEFNLLLEVTNRLMSERGMQDRQAAVDMARHTLTLYDKVMRNSGRIGFRKYEPDRFLSLVMDALIKGDLPCIHGHIAPITDCGACSRQARVNKYVQNPTKPSLCDHTRLDYSVPCPACVTEEEDALEQKLAERERFRAQAGLVQAVRRSGKLKSNEAELNAIIGVLLEKMGGSAELTQLDMEYISEMVAEGAATYAVVPSPMSFSVRLEKINQRPLRVSPSNPSAPNGDPGRTPRMWSQDDEDLPF